LDLQDNGKIERVDNITVEEFIHNFEIPNQPVIIKGLSTSWDVLFIIEYVVGVKMVDI
jgi:hypothetical protein